jgi:hypothetical protein
MKGLKWDKNKGTKGYLWLVIDDAGVVGVSGAMYGTGSYGSQSMGAWTGAAADAPTDMSEAAIGAWTAVAADAPAADAPAAMLEAAMGA